MPGNAVEAIMSKFPNLQPSAYSMYNGWLNSSLATGNAATGDYERLNSPAENAALAKLVGSVRHRAAVGHQQRPGHRH